MGTGVLRRGDQEAGWPTVQAGDGQDAGVHAGRCRGQSRGARDSYVVALSQGLRGRQYLETEFEEVAKFS